MAKKKDISELDLLINTYDKAIDIFAEDVLLKIESAYESAIEAFYNDYSGPNIPKVYQRTYSTYLASSGYQQLYTPWNIQKFGGFTITGINISETNIPGNPYKAWKGWVFNRTFKYGIHGYNYSDKRKMNKNRTKETRVKWKPIKNMKPAPQVLMDRQFRQITKRASMDAMFSEALLKAGW